MRKFGQARTRSWWWGKEVDSEEIRKSRPPVGREHCPGHQADGGVAGKRSIRWMISHSESIDPWGDSLERTDERARPGQARYIARSAVEGVRKQVELGYSGLPHARSTSRRRWGGLPGNPASSVGPARGTGDRTAMPRTSRDRKHLAMSRHVHLS